MSEVKTWRTKPRALTPHQHGTDRLLRLIPATAVPSKVPAPLGDLRSASAAAIVAAADTGWDDWATESGDRAAALRLLLAPNLASGSEARGEWLGLAGVPGLGWSVSVGRG